MSNFICEHCGALCYDTPEGYISGCEHYPPDINKAGLKVKNKTYYRRGYKKGKIKKLMAEE